MAAHRKLVEMGVRKPSIRMVLYLLLELPGWSKSHYDTLCGKLGEWRDKGLIEYGLFADDGAGSNYKPLTSREIAERISALKDLIPAKLGRDGKLHVVFVEHISLVDTIAEMLDYEIPVVSSQGQLRREHLHGFMLDCMRALEELDGKAIEVVALTDYDKGGTEIFETHRRWLKGIFNVDVKRWAITREQIHAARLPDHEAHQLDGWMARYGIARVRREPRRSVGLP
jgi:hypothetical protein